MTADLPLLGRTVGIGGPAWSSARPYPTFLGRYSALEVQGLNRHQVVPRPC